MTWDEATKLVEELVTLNDGYLSERVFLTNDVWSSYMTSSTMAPIKGGLSNLYKIKVNKTVDFSQRPVL